MKKVETVIETVESTEVELEAKPELELDEELEHELDEEQENWSFFKKLDREREKHAIAFVVAKAGGHYEG